MTRCCFLNTPSFFPVAASCVTSFQFKETQKTPRGRLDDYACLMRLRKAVAKPLAPDEPSLSPRWRGRMPRESKVSNAKSVQTPTTFTRCELPSCRRTLALVRVGGPDRFGSKRQVAPPTAAEDASVTGHPFASSNSDGTTNRSWGKLYIKPIPAMTVGRTPLLECSGRCRGYWPKSQTQSGAIPAYISTRRRPFGVHAYKL